MILRCTLSLCKSEWCTALTSFLRVHSLSVYVASPRGFLICVGESDPSQTPENRSYSLAVLLTLCNVFIFVPSPLAFLLPLPALLPLIEHFPQHLSVFPSPLSLESLFSLYVWVYVCVWISLLIWLLVQFLWHLSSSETFFQMVIHRALFSTIVRGVLMYGKRRAEQICQWGWNVNRRGLN